MIREALTIAAEAIGFAVMGGAVALLAFTAAVVAARFWRGSRELDDAEADSLRIPVDVSLDDLGASELPHQVANDDDQPGAA